MKLICDHFHGNKISTRNVEPFRFYHKMQRRQLDMHPYIGMKPSKLLLKKRNMLLKMLALYFTTAIILTAPNTVIQHRSILQLQI